MISQRWLPWLVAVMLLSGCATLSLPNAQHGWIEGDGYRHFWIAREGKAATPDAPLHVYVEGDGRPWLRRHLPAPDPTPGHLLALALMAQDTAPALYLGRPCYFGSAADRGCDVGRWTSGRYGEDIIDSMAAALERWRHRHAPQRRLRLIGYSGGGVIAVLLASRLTQVDAVITLAANLDTDAWTDRHGYSRLDASLNPATLPPLPPPIRQWHLAGRDDRNVPPASQARYLARNPTARQQIIDGFDHRCCWESVWPQAAEALFDPPQARPRIDTNISRN